MPKKITKRDGRVVDFDSSRIEAAVTAAANAVEAPQQEELIHEIVDSVVAACGESETVESVQDKVIRALEKFGCDNIAKAYSAYRKRRTYIRENSTALLDKIDSFFTEQMSDDSTHKENANINATSVSGAFYRIGSEASKDYYNRQLIPKEFVEAYDKGYIRYHERLVA